MSIYPPCFRNKVQFNEWMYFARVAKERVTICDDCTEEYESLMTRMNRCIKNLDDCCEKTTDFNIFLRKK
jgi:hypothetical protein